MRELPWPHAPWHDISQAGVYLITGATLDKLPFFHHRERLTFLEQRLFDLSREHDQELHAWSVFPNHYHFITRAARENALAPMVKRLHTETSSWLRERDGITPEHVWFNFWDSRLTFEKSYMARLKYVHQNPVHHGVARAAENYPWCSANWFVQTAPKSFVKTVMSFKVDQLSVKDEFIVPRSAYREDD